MTNDRSIALDESTCRQLLGAGTLGRLAVNGDPSPTILPVNYVLHGDVVAFRTVEGTKLAAAQDGAMASFEVDGVYPDHDSGWSVVVCGRLEETEDVSGDLAAAVDRLHSIVGGDRPHVIVLHMEQLTGRQVRADRDWIEAHTETTTWRDRDASDLMG